jgi:hypothetical protein
VIFVVVTVTEVADCGNSIILQIYPWTIFQVFDFIHLDLPAPFASSLSGSARTAYYPLLSDGSNADFMDTTTSMGLIPDGLERSKIQKDELSFRQYMIFSLFVSMP